MPACLSQITMRNFWEKPWPCGGKYPTDFTRIGFHPIKRALARFTGMLCLPHAALATNNSCKLTSLQRAAAEASASPPGKRTGRKKQGLWQHPVASSHCQQLQLLSLQPLLWSEHGNQHPSDSQENLLMYRDLIYLLSGSFTVVVRVYPETEGHNSKIIALFFC